MIRPQVTIAPLPAAGDETPPVGLFVSGILVTRAKAVIAEPGADILVVLPAGSVSVELPPIVPGGRVASAPAVPFGTRLPTDGQA